MIRIVKGLGQWLVVEDGKVIWTAPTIQACETFLHATRPLATWRVAG